MRTSASRANTSRIPLKRYVLVPLICTILGASAAGTGLQSVQPPLPEVQKLGPQVGSRVPDFTLLDQNGRSRALMSLMGPKGLMLVFFRSADW